MDSIRQKYQTYGVKNYYQWYFDQYKNPHEPIIHKSITFIDNNWDVDFSKTLDIACGKGEVTKMLVKLGYNNISAIDAYSCKYYEEETDGKCRTITFDDIINGKLDGEKYSILVSSFALHLLEESKLPIFLYKLTQLSDKLLIITPHKRPEIKEEWGWKLVDEVNIDRVKSRLYENIYF